MKTKYAEIQLPKIHVLLYRETLPVKVTPDPDAPTWLLKGDGNGAPKSFGCTPGLVWRFNNDGTISRMNVEKGTPIFKSDAGKTSWSELRGEYDLPAYCMAPTDGAEYAFYPDVQMIRKVQPRRVLNG